MPDILLSRYQIVQKLGSGGFGDTYLAKDLALPGHPDCVVKHLQPKEADPSVITVAKTLFEREAEYLYRLGKHDRIPSLYAHFEENGEFYLVQEFIDGEELSQELVPRRPLSEAQTIALLQEILEILAVVHQENIIHRDIKPSNIMRRKRDGKLVLIDFGAVKEISALAITTEGRTTLTRSIGTLGYMPSEQAQGKPKLASDVYAVGAIAIQAITGLLPDELPEDPQTGEILWRDRAKVSDRFADFLAKMIHEYYRARYQNASEALRALMSFTDRSNSAPQSSVATWVASDIAPSQPRVPSKLLKIASFAVIGGVVIGGTLAGIVLFYRPSSSPPVVRNEPTTEPTPLETPSPSPTLEPTISPSPSPTPTETPEVQVPATPSPTPTVAPTPTPEPTPSTTVATVFDPPSFVRTQPDATGSILCQIRTVKTITIYESENGWYRTDACGTTGYIHQSQIRF
jgi:serine/threonine protein kinase